MLTFDPLPTAAVTAAALAGGVLQGFTGFGFAMVAVPFLGFFMPPVEALPYVLMLQALVGAAGLPGAVADCRWHALGWLALGVVLGTPVGLWIINLVSPTMGRLIVGLVVLAACAVLTAGLRLHATHLLRATIGAGLVSGVMNGLAGMSGPPAVALLLGAGATSKEIRATMIVFVFGAALAALAPFAILGKVSGEMMGPLLPATVALSLGRAAGQQVFDRTSTSTHRKGAVSILAILGVTTALGAVVGLLRP
jgi:uncharacterized membrane protein YfcA